MHSYARKCIKPLVQRYKAKQVVTIHNNIDQTFWIFYFLCVLGFLTQKQIKIDKKKMQKHSKQITNKHNFQHMLER